jgi:NAD(P)-dependent dehydrogenase (short-subunit alcohol dehydrogenase family)
MTSDPQRVAIEEDARVSEQVVVITGASDGIGAAAARLLKAKGDHVILVGRSPQKTERVARELDCSFYLADFANFDEVRALAEHLKKEVPHIDVLANNAGGRMGARLITVDGNELTLQVNHLAPFLLTNLLLENLVASKASVITTASSANRGAGTLDLNDLNLEKGYSADRAYAKAKLMNILFTKELDRRYHEAGINSACFHPGLVRTNFSNEFGGSFSFVYTTIVKGLLRSPQKGAETLVWLASREPGEYWTSGEFYQDKVIARANKQVYVDGLAQSLWDLSLRVTSLK